MAVYKLHYTQHINAEVDTVWKFFSDANNLRAITPEYMRFVITGDIPETVYAGQIITYKVSPLFNIPLSWMTEITHVEQHKRFVDEQRVGPYKFWHHEHRFEPANGGTLMTDIVHYSLPLGILGRIAHSLFIKRQLQDIFGFRRQRISEIFD